MHKKKLPYLTKSNSNKQKKKKLKVPRNQLRNVIIGLFQILSDFLSVESKNTSIYDWNDKMIAQHTNAATTPTAICSLVLQFNGVRRGSARTRQAKRIRYICMHK